ncbi:MAG: hypothetical protein JWP87_4776 [Labilithrix sp.]|nr:hypothetical protein [Labilithrix sp.]
MERSCAHRARKSRPATVGDLFGEERVQQRFVGPLSFLGALDEIAPDAARTGEMKALQERLEIGAHDGPPFDSARLDGSASCRPS